MGAECYYIEDNILIIAKQNRTTIGVIGMRAPSYKRPFAELDLLFIDNHFIGQGYGKELWNKAKDIAQELKWDSFRFISDQLPEVIGFYEKMGAKIVKHLSFNTGCFPMMEYILPKPELS